MNNACRVHYCFRYFVPRPIKATPYDTGHTVSPPDLVHKCIYITRRELSQVWFRRPCSVQFNVLHLMLQSKYDTKYTALLLIASHAKGQRKIVATADKKPRARYSDKDEHQQHFQDVFKSVLCVVCCSFAIFLLHHKQQSRSCGEYCFSRCCMELFLTHSSYLLFGCRRNCASFITYIYQPLLSLEFGNILNRGDKKCSKCD